MDLKFDADAVRVEVRRILKPGGCCALIWNERQADTSPFARAYEDFLLEWGVDYERVKASYENRMQIAKVLGSKYVTRSFPHAQAMGLQTFRTRTQSASYVPRAETARGQAMMRVLDELFARFEEKGFVRFDYLANLYCARVGSTENAGCHA